MPRKAACCSPGFEAPTPAGRKRPAAVGCTLRGQRQHVSRNPVTHSASLGVLQNFREGTPHVVFKLAVDLGFQPKIALAILYPFKADASYRCTEPRIA